MAEGGFQEGKVLTAMRGGEERVLGEGADLEVAFVAVLFFEGDGCLEAFEVGGVVDFDEGADGAYACGNAFVEETSTASRLGVRINDLMRLDRDLSGETVDIEL